MQYDPDIHHRRSIRLRDYDYSQAGAYFITICSHNRNLLFGDIVNGEMCTNQIGKIVHDQWKALYQRFPAIELDEFVVMPNHLHAILVFNQIEDSAADVTTIGEIVGAFKSLCVHNCLQWVKDNEPDRFIGKVWQRNYWEHVVRNTREMDNIRMYIQQNPAKWSTDKLFVPS